MGLALVVGPAKAGKIARLLEAYLDGRTIADFRPAHLRIVKARDIGLDADEQALVSLVRSWRIRRARQAA